MLIVTRKTDESITIEPLDGVDPEMTLGEAFRNGPIEVKLIRINRSRVRLAIAAPAEFQVWRGRPNVATMAPMKSVQYEPTDGSVEYKIAADL